jgi:hypothetical protein
MMSFREQGIALRKARHAPRIVSHSHSPVFRRASVGFNAFLVLANL